MIGEPIPMQNKRLTYSQSMRFFKTIKCFTLIKATESPHWGHSSRFTQSSFYAEIGKLNFVLFSLRLLVRSYEYCIALLAKEFSSECTLIWFV